MNNKQIVGAILGCVLAGAAGGLVVKLFSPAAQSAAPQALGASPTGSTFTAQKQLAIVMNLAAGTTTSVQNTGSSDIFITTFNYACTGVGTSNLAYTGAGGIANLTIKAATTSTTFVGATPTANATVANTNLALTATNISTSTAVTVVSSSTIQDITPVFMDVPAGSYLTFITNATNTAVCTVAAEYVGS